ncbi:Transcriptional regulator, MerR family [Burkholderia multivorans]
MRKTSPSPAPARDTPDREYTIDELARATDSTVRNVRAYQDRGLLGPPRRRGRAGIYDDTHAERLRLIHRLLARGYTLANIMDLITVVDEGNDLRRVLGLEPAVDAGRQDGRKALRPAVAPVAIAGEEASLAVLARIAGLASASRDAGASDAASAGAIEELLGTVRDARPHLAAIAESLVSLVLRQLGDDGDEPQSASRAAALVEAIWRIWPIGMMLIESEMNRALKESSDSCLATRVAAMFNAPDTR